MLLGLDISTGSAKAVPFDENGNTVAEAGAAYSVDAPRCSAALRLAAGRLTT